MAAFQNDMVGITRPICDTKPTYMVNAIYEGYTNENASHKYHGKFAYPNFTTNNAVDAILFHGYTLRATKPQGAY